MSAPRPAHKPGPAKNDAAKKDDTVAEVKNGTPPASVPTSPVPTITAPEPVVIKTGIDAIYDGADLLGKSMLAVLLQSNSRYTVAYAKKAAATGDPKTAITSFMETSEDPIAVALRMRIEQARAELERHAKETVKTSVLSEDELKALDVEIEAAKKKVINGRDAIKSMLVAEMSDDPEGIAAAFAEIPNPTKGKGRATSALSGVGTTGSNLPRANVKAVITGGNFTEDEPLRADKFSDVAKALNTTVEPLLEAFADAADRSPNKPSNVETIAVAAMNIKLVTWPVEFDYQPNATGPTYTIKTTHKERAKPGARPGI